MQGKRTSLYTWFLSLMALAAVALLAGRPAMAREYEIAPGDTLSIKVIGEDEYSHSYSVSDEGKISIPNVGQVMAGGKTVNELTADVTKRLKVYLKNPTVIIEVTSPIVNRVWITGAVAKPGEYRVKPDARLSSLLQDAGGLTDLADRPKATLLRRGEKEAKPIDVDAVVRGADPAKDIAIEAGDTIYIPKKIEGKIKVLGEVATPGEKDITPNMTPMEAINVVGGFKPSADKTNVVIQHKDGTRVTIDLEAEASNPLLSNLYLQEGDVLFVPNNENSQIEVSGAGVKTPGRYPYTSTMRVMDAVLKAGSFIDGANKEEVSVIHKDGQTAKVDLDKYLREGDITQNVNLQKGDVVLVGMATSESNQVEVTGLGVKNPGKYPYDSGMRVMDAIVKAGSFAERARLKDVSVVHKTGESKKVDMARFLNDGDVAQNMPLQKGDMILVGADREKGPSNNNNSQWINALIGTLSSALIWKSIYR